MNQLVQPQSALLSCEALDIAVQECRLVETLSLALQPGTVTAVLGRNGAGKSLTLHTLAGLRPSPAGQVRLQGQPLDSLPRRQIAQQMSFVPQDIEEPFPVSVLECAVAGRHPHLDFWQWESPRDFQLARQALADVDMAAFESRSMDTLSGGERRRVAIATALTQQPRLFLLDEPTNHLDPQHQLQVLKVLRSRAEAGCAVLMSLHDPGLAARFADRVLLLFGNGQWLHGTTSELLTAEHLSRLYRTPTLALSTPTGTGFVFT